MEAKMDELTVKETFNNLQEQLQNDIYFIMGITPDQYAKMVFDACMRLLVFRKDKGGAKWDQQQLSSLFYMRTI